MLSEDGEAHYGEHVEYWYNECGKYRRYCRALAGKESVCYRYADQREIRAEGGLQKNSSRTRRGSQQLYDRNRYEENEHQDDDGIHDEAQINVADALDIINFGGNRQ